MPAADSDGLTRTLQRRVWVVALVVFCVALGVRLAYLDQLGQTPLLDTRGFVRDSAYYHLRAKEIAAGDLMGQWPGFLSPVYCYFVGLVYALAGDSIRGVLTSQAVLGGLTCALLYYIGQYAYGQIAGLIAGLLLSLYALHIYYTGLVLPTVLVVFLNVLFIAIMVGGRAALNRTRCMFGGFVCGLAVAVKMNAILLLPVCLLWLWFGHRHESSRQRVSCGLLLVFGAALAISPFTARNYLVSGRFVLVTTTGGENLVKAFGPTANGTHVHLPRALWDRAQLKNYLRRRITPRKAIDDSRAMTNWALRYASQHPMRTAALVLKKLRLFFNHLELFIRDQFYFAKMQIPFLRLPLVGFGLIAPIGLFAFLRAPRGRRSDWLVRLVMWAQVVSFSLIFVLARYRLVFVTGLILLAGWQLVSWIQQVRRRKWVALGGQLVAVTAIAMFVRWPIRGSLPAPDFSKHYTFLGDRYLERGDYSAAMKAYEKSGNRIESRAARELRLLRLLASRLPSESSNKRRQALLQEQDQCLLPENAEAAPARLLADPAGSR